MTAEIDYDWFNWPDDEEHIRKYATVDFGSSLEEVVQQPERDFEAIRPLGACDPSWQNHAWFELQPAREALSAEVNP